MGNTFDSRSSSTASSTSVSTATSNEGSGFTLDGFLSGLSGLMPGAQPANGTTAPTPPRIVQGDGNYVYQQNPDGEIRIIAGPNLVGESFAVGTPRNTAITAQIGPYKSPIPAAPATGGNPSSGIIETISGFDPIGALRDLFGGASEEPIGEAPAAPTAPTPNPAFNDGTRTVEGSTLAVAGSRLGMETGYELDAAHGQTTQEREAMRTGDKNAASFFCSGFTEWTLAASGYDMKEPLRGADGVAFSYTDARAPKQPGTEVTIGMLINGQAEAVTTMAEVERTKKVNGGWVLHLDKTNLYSGYKTGVDAGEAAMKGAAGAFELAGIGAEVAESAQRPGDFAQARWTNQIAGEDTHIGDGHAWQVWSVRVRGAAMFGKPGSPKPLSGELEGWQTNVEFTIDDATDPTLVGDIVVTAAERIEANVAGAGSQGTREGKDQDQTNNGGVGVSGFVAVPDTAGPKRYKNFVAFYARLSASKWAAWKPATPPKE